MSWVCLITLLLYFGLCPAFLPLLTPSIMLRTHFLAEREVFFSVRSIQVAFYNHFACRFQFFASSSFLFFKVLYCKGKCQRFLLLIKLFHMLNCVWELICHHKITNSFFSRSGGGAGGRRGNELQRIASNLSENNSRGWLTFIEHSQDVDTILSALHVVKSS